MPSISYLPHSIVGMFLSFLAVLFGVLTGVLVKEVSADVTLLTTLFYRFLFSLPILFALALYMRGRDWLHINQRKTLCLRVCFGFSGIVFWFLSLRNMPFGLATALFQSSVIFITLMSPFLLREKVGPYRWCAVIAGLSGVIIITNPFSGDVTKAALFGLGAALSGAFLAIILRRLGKRDAPISVACWYNGSGFLIVSLVVLALPEHFDVVSHPVMLDLVWLGFIGAAMQIVYTTAYSYTDAVAVASMRYLQMPVSAVFGYLLFAEVMTLAEICGALIIITSCLFIAWRELRRSKEINKTGI